MSAPSETIEIYCVKCKARTRSRNITVPEYHAHNPEERPSRHPLDLCRARCHEVPLGGGADPEMVAPVPMATGAVRAPRLTSMKPFCPWPFNYLLPTTNIFLLGVLVHYADNDYFVR